MAAGYGTRCPDCYWRAVFEKRVEQNGFLFTSDLWRSVFSSYAEWIGKTYEPRVAALRIHGDAGFLADVSRLGPEIPSPTAFVEAFPPSVLTRHRIVSEFLAAKYDLRPSDQDRESITERRRIAASLAAFEGRSTAERVLHEYHDELMALCDRGKLSIRTVRMYLKAATGPTTSALEARRDRIDPADLRTFLRRHPGQKATVTRFATYLGLSISAPSKSSKVNDRSRAKAALRTLARHPSLDVEEERRWMEAALQVYHSMSEVEARSVLSKARTDRADAERHRNRARWPKIRRATSWRRSSCNSLDFSTSAFAQQLGRGRLDRYPGFVECRVRPPSSVDALTFRISMTPVPERDGHDRLATCSGPRRTAFGFDFAPNGNVWKVRLIMSSDCKRTEDDGLDRRKVTENAGGDAIEVRDDDAFAAHFERLRLPMPNASILPRNFIAAASPGDFVFEQLTSTILVLGRRAGLTVEVVGPPDYRTIHEKDYEIVAPLLQFSHAFLLEGGAVLAVNYLDNLARHIASRWGKKKAAETDAAVDLIVTRDKQSKRIAYRGPVSGISKIVEVARVAFEEENDAR